MLKQAYSNPKLATLKPSRSVDTDLVKPGDFDSTKNNPSQSTVSAYNESKAYSLQISRTKSTKNLLKEPPRITAKAMSPLRSSQKCVARRSNVKPGKQASISLDLSKDDGITTLEIVKCLARAVFSEINSNDADRGTFVEVFVDETSSFPSLNTVESFFLKIFTSKDLSTECAVTSAAFVDQLFHTSRIKLNSSNWKRVCFISVLEADKVLRDKLVWNEDYKDLIPGIDLLVLRKLERAFLKYIEFNLTLSQGEYAKYYFDLISLREPQRVGRTQEVSDED